MHQITLTPMHCIVDEVDNALRAPRADNPHARRLLRWAANPVDAITIAVLISNRNAPLLRAIDDTERSDEYSHSVQARAASLAVPLPATDLTALVFAIDAAFSLSLGIPIFYHDQYAVALVGNPRGLVRAAYALNRDLTTWRFEGED